MMKRKRRRKKKSKKFQLVKEIKKLSRELFGRHPTKVIPNKKKRYNRRKEKKVIGDKYVD